ncbi:hypothetical protein FMUND_13324 [Fusarium mundagurra]|uniref:Uncharacterized protein n=1 Tax=Fusarium mundagurra TaxID=1567541 RepID=A0A8H5XZL4_9HYPO|nr:hypothetical protein FMUND_13324 [Fusarium mundagurra]
MKLNLSHSPHAKGSQDSPPSHTAYNLTTNIAQTNEVPTDKEGTTTRKRRQGIQNTISQYTPDDPQLNFVDLPFFEFGIEIQCKIEFDACRHFIEEENITIHENDREGLKCEAYIDRRRLLRKTSESQLATSC